jgi:hypothetical protein
MMLCGLVLILASQDRAVTKAPAPKGVSVEERVYPKNIDSIIALGLQKKRAGLALSSGFSAITAAMSGEGTVGFSATLFTVDTWIQNLAADAADKYLPFKKEDLRSEDLVNAFRVVANANKPVNMNAARQAESVKHIVIRDTKKVNVIQPEATAPFDDTVGNAFNAKVNLTGLHAFFDWEKIEDLRKNDAKREFLVTVIGDRTEKDFKVKTKHFDDLRISVR